ncbi:hypothetical protein M5K25_016561 [Dendrobium thyrsiflorum]|uniref:26S proteasome regulatory subunit Rpn7 N-terminal domain-containing protein n=1 Tax=Dendrobium thyrsiflorum TaxID=117978 RepID=A0ABD0UJW8_DENTH
MLGREVAGVLRLYGEPDGLREGQPAGRRQNSECWSERERRLLREENRLQWHEFLETGPELGNNYSEVIAPQDVATYGGLCALASFDRTELKNKVIDNISFRNFLELVPEVRELINDFYAR